MRAFALVACIGISASACDAVAPRETARFDLGELIGTWRWLLRTTVDGTTRIEDEVWQFAPGATPSTLQGRYVRTAELRANDRVPFVCNQRPRYAQRAVFDVTAAPVGASGFAIIETADRTEPSPCDHGFRHLGAYTATLHGSELTLAWEGGSQILLHVDATTPTLVADPWPSASDATLAGAWRWDATTYDDAGNITDESEWWEITRRSDHTLDGTYRRRVSVRSADGNPIACAGGPSWSFDDAYVLDMEREDEHWHLHERATAAGDHPCLRSSPQRVLDEATAEQLGDHLVLEWRGKRRQVLYRAALGE